MPPRLNQVQNRPNGGADGAPPLEVCQSLISPTELPASAAKCPRRPASMTSHHRRAEAKEERAKARAKAEANSKALLTARSTKPTPSQRVPMEEAAGSPAHSIHCREQATQGSYNQPRNQ